MSTGCGLRPDGEPVRASGAERSALEHYVAPLRPHLSGATVTELCVNRPGELWVEASDSGWQAIAAPWATYRWAAHLGRLLAGASQQRLSPEHPLLSTALPDGERVQVVAPPATESGVIALAIRKPGARRCDLAELAAGGLLRLCRQAGETGEADRALAAAYDAQDWLTFLRLAVRARQTLLVSGATGSGKTTLTRALIAEIDPSERLVTIEDAPELTLDGHRNAVRLFYSKDEQGLSRLTPKHLLESCLRLRPERIMLAELRGAEAYEYLRSVNSGHPGSITSIHAGSCGGAFEQLALLVKESAAGREMRRGEIHELLCNVVDVVVQCRRQGGVRRVDEIWWRGRATRLTLD
jgi:type IV secretion system protein VirB11